MDASNWVSAVSSVVGTVATILTLVAFYIGAVKLLSQNRMYMHGLSRRSLGPWQKLCSNWELLFLQRRILTPSLNLKSLVEGQWAPDITFPTGFLKDPKDTEQGEILADTTWVNFMQALGINPNDVDRFEMQDAPGLVNRTITMSWTGKDLVGLCSILGFQVHECHPNPNSPMSLPAQWPGPLGWLQFRASSNDCITSVNNDCIAEFRCRMGLKNQISERLHDYYKKAGCSSDFPRPDMLRSRLWNSISGLTLAENKTLFLGGAETNPRPEEEDELYTTTDGMFADPLSQDYSGDEIRRKLFGTTEKHSQAFRQEVRQGSYTRSGLGNDDMDASNVQSGDTPRNTKRRQCLKKVMRPCPGLLSVDMNGELAYNLGLSVDKNCIEYSRRLTAAENVDCQKYQYNLGNLYMDKTLLKLMKEAVLLLRPDGFHFSPARRLDEDLRDVYKNIEDQSNRLRQVFPEKCIVRLRRKENLLESSSSSSNGVSWTAIDEDVCLSFAMELCNDLQRTRKAARECYTVEDMKLLAKAESSARRLVLRQSPNGQDLIWAVLCCRELSRAVLKALEKDDSAGFFDAKLTAKIQANGETILVCPELKGCVEGTRNGADVNMEDGVFRALLVSEGEFTGTQIVAAISVVFITYYWINKGWVTSVAEYGAAMPQTVLMC